MPNGLTPSKETNTVFSESNNVLKLEFLDHPAIWTDYNFNHALEVFVHWIRIFMDSICGAIRISGFTATKVGSNLELSSGLILYKNFIIRSLATQTFPFDTVNNNRSLYIKIEVVKKDFNNDPISTGVQIAGFSQTQPGTNQYRYNVTYNYPSAGIPSDTATGFHFELLRTNVDGTVTMSLPLYQGKLAESLHKQNTDGFTTSSTFKIAANADGTGGVAVLTQLPLPRQPLNVRITDITPIRPDNLHNDAKTKVSRNIRVGVVSTKSKVIIKWGYDNVIGIGGNGTFTINNDTALEPSYIFSQNQLAGYLLFLPPPLDKELLINSNASTSGNATVLNILDVDTLQPVDLTGNVILINNPAVIHSNASSYDFAVIPHDKVAVATAQTQKPDEGIYGSKSYSSSPTQQSVVLELDIGTYFTFKVAAKNGEKVSSFTELPAGNFVKYGVVQDYKKPFLVQLPLISDAGVVLELLSSDFGFIANISGWNEATDIELVWNVGGNADFENLEHSTKITSDRKVQIETLTSKTYTVGVRALHGGYVVSGGGGNTSVVNGILYGAVTSGGGGLGPQGEVIADFHISLKTYSGTASVISGNIDISLSNIKSPAGSTISVDIFPDLTNQIVKDSSGNEFIITESNSTGTGIAKMSVVPATSAGTSGTAVFNGSTFEINTTKRGRLLHKKTDLPADYKLTKMLFEVGYTNPTGGKIRVYQQNVESAADIMLINTSDTTIPQDIDVEIRSSFGARNMIVDAFDISATPNNTANMVGDIAIYAQKITIRTTELGVTTSTVGITKGGLT